jgi:hypothetical protein
MVGAHSDKQITTHLLGSSIYRASELPIFTNTSTLSFPFPTFQASMKLSWLLNYVLLSGLAVAQVSDWKMTGWGPVVRDALQFSPRAQVPPACSCPAWTGITCGGSGVAVWQHIPTTPRLPLTKANRNASVSTSPICHAGNKIATGARFQSLLVLPHFGALPQVRKLLVNIS